VGIVWVVKSILLPDMEEEVAQSTGTWEPFGVYKGKLWMKKEIHTEADEPRSSAHTTEAADLGEHFATQDLPE
jgi:hypothetical protein